MKQRTIVLLLLLTIICGCATSNKPDVAWKNLVKTDLEFIHQTISENHPGPIDHENPEFGNWLETGKQEALKMNKSADGYDSYKSILSKYVEGFNDGHLNFWTKYDRSSLLWPEFMISYRNGKYIVYQSDAKSPREGDELLSCDNKKISTLYKTNVYPFHGFPEPKSKRYRLAPYLFIDEGNPFISMPKVCEFSRKGKKTSLTLSYKKKDRKGLKKIISDATFGPKPKFSYEKVGKNKYWVTLPTFGPNDEQAKLMKKYISKVGKLSKTKSTIVFDVRGNSGGSSSWGNMIVENLYGKDNLKRIEGQLHGRVVIDWRVSDENFKAISKWPKFFSKRYGPKHEMTTWAKKFAGQFAKAIESGKKTIRQDPDKKMVQKEIPFNLDKSKSFKGKIFLLTDGRCGSACLDFADVILALPNSVHVGLETAADTVYMEGNIIDTLPSGLGSLYYPMKVWRNRTRGNRESYKPKHVWQGEMSDTKSLKKWIFDKLAK